MNSQEIVIEFTLKSATNPYPVHYNNLYQNILKKKLQNYVLEHYYYKIVNFDAEIENIKTEEFDEDMLIIGFKIRKDTLNSEIIGKIISDLVIIFKKHLLEIISISSDDPEYSKCLTIYNH